MKRLTDRFIAFDDGGRKYILFVFTEYTEAGTSGGPSDMIEGWKEVQTSEGQEVNVVSHGVYKIVRSGVMLRSDAKNAL